MLRQSGALVYYGKEICKIENVQWRASKKIPGLKNLNYKERLQKLKVPYIRPKCLIVTNLSNISPDDRQISTLLNVHSRTLAFWPMYEDMPMFIFAM